VTEDSYALARRVVDYSLTKKAQDVSVMDLRPLTSVTDYFVVCHGESDVQVKAITDAITDGLREEGVRYWHREGYEYLHWVLLDYVDVVVHIFQKDERTFYGLERLWGDAETETYSE
jgi:ribosome-associated protein